ncbi:hypothetical protein BDV93DRAFT_512068 [Ceratobasidium sp. AG-I]|nr:hypothetical protein BDV93DRAFT_512068 [Ceratobasidium sp. AG-I]
MHATGVPLFEQLALPILSIPARCAAGLGAAHAGYTCAASYPRLIVIIRMRARDRCTFGVNNVGIGAARCKCTDPFCNGQVALRFPALDVHACYHPGQGNSNYLAVRLTQGTGSSPEHFGLSALNVRTTERSSLRELVASDPDPSRPTTPEPTTSTGPRRLFSHCIHSLVVVADSVARGRALYDSPPPDSQSEDLGRAQRRRRSTSRGITWAEEVQKSATRSKRNRCTRARKARKTQTLVPGNDEATNGDSQATSAST